MRLGAQIKACGSLAFGPILTVGHSIARGADTEAMTESAGAINSRKGQVESHLNHGLYCLSPWVAPVGGLKVRASMRSRGQKRRSSRSPGACALSSARRRFLPGIGHRHGAYKDASAPTLEDRKSNPGFTDAARDLGRYELKGSFAHAEVGKGAINDPSRHWLTTSSIRRKGPFGGWGLGLMASKRFPKSLNSSFTGNLQPEITKFSAGHCYNFSKNVHCAPSIAFETLSGAVCKTGRNGCGTTRDWRDNACVEKGFRLDF